MLICTMCNAILDSPGPRASGVEWRPSKRTPQELHFMLARKGDGSMQGVHESSIALANSSKACFTAPDCFSCGLTPTLIISNQTEQLGRPRAAWSSPQSSTMPGMAQSSSPGRPGVATLEAPGARSRPTRGVRVAVRHPPHPVSLSTLFGDQAKCLQHH